MMNKLFSFIAVLFLSAVLLTGCSKNKPETVAKEWLSAVYNEHFDVARSLSTAETQLLLKKDKPAGAPGQVSKNINVTIVSSESKGDNATVTYTTSENPGEAKPPLYLVKKDGKWLVSL